MAYSLLRDVNSNTQSWRVRVRIARFWEHLDAKKDNEILRLQFVMVNEKGCAMQCSVAKSHVERFRGKLVEGHAYYLHYMEVKQARDNFRAVDHCFEAWLTRWTEITEITPIPESLPRYAYKLRSFQSLLASEGDRTYLADVLGIVTGVSPVVTLEVKGRPVSKRTLRLSDTRETATVALWSENAESIDSEVLIDTSSREPVVALVMGCTYRRHDSVLELSASYGSQVCINADIPEIVALRDRLVGSVQQVELIMERGRRFETEAATAATVPELAKMNPHLAAGKKFRSKVTIDGLQSNQGWWFMSCDSCSWKAVAEGTANRCTKERCTSKHASPRYRVPVIASRDGASVEMVFFGDTARDLICKPVDVLLAENCTLVSAVPDEITGLVGRNYVVDLAVSRFSFRKEDISFQVLKFYPEGSSVFAGVTKALLTEGILTNQPSTSGLADRERQDDIHVKLVETTIQTPPPAATLSHEKAETTIQTPPPAATLSHEKETSGEADEIDEANSVDANESDRQHADKRPAVKRPLFPDDSAKSKKKVLASRCCLLRFLLYCEGPSFVYIVPA